MTRRRGVRPGAVLALLLLASVVGSAHAQPVVLHEPVAAPKLRCDSGACRSEGAPPESLPEAVLSGEGLIAAPSSRPAPGADEQVYSQASSVENPLARGAPQPGTDPPPTRRSRMLPDAETGPEQPGERLYHEVFNPAVFPYKRMTALDVVDSDGALAIEVPGLRPLPVGDGRVSPGRDPFYGSVVVVFDSDKPVPLPTPAAGIRLLSYKSSPPRTLSFYLDGAENLYVRSPVRGRHRVIYLVDAAPTYFAGPLWQRGERRAQLRDVPRAMVPALPGRFRREAARVLRHINLRPEPDSDYQEVLSRLVGYFRAFQLGELDEASADKSLYLRISLSQRGVCRHRGYAFVITALAAGIPARYVENELHVFVEVYVPHDGGGAWRRINLGGAPLQQRVVEGETKVAYREKGGDPFERPPSFQSGTPPQVTGLPKRTGRGEPGTGSRGAGELPPLDGPEDRARRGEKPGAPDSARGPAPGERGDKGARGPEAGPTSKPGDKPGGKPGDKAGGPGGGSGPGGSSGSGEPSSGGAEDEPAGPELPGEDDVARPDDRRREPSSGALIPTRVTLGLAPGAGTIYRGSSVPLRGSVQAARGSAAGLEVLILLAAPDGVRQLGRAFTTADGSFQADVEIPAGTPLGRFPLIARVRGDDTRRGSSTSTNGAYDR